MNYHRMVILVMLAAFLSAVGLADDDDDKPDNKKTDSTVKSDSKNDDMKPVRFSPSARRSADLGIEAAGDGRIERVLTVPGEIALNADCVARVSPAAAGIVLKILKSTGDRVAAGETLAVVKSAELANAKIEYFTAKLNLELAASDFERETAIRSNTQRLLDAMESQPEPHDLEKITGALPLGEIKSKLLSAYSSLHLAKAALARAEKLKVEKIVSVSSVENAVKELETAQAEYLGLYEELKITYKSRHLQSQRALRIAETGLQNSVRRLNIFGLTNADLAGLSNEKEDDVALFQIRAPFSGVILERRIGIGEHVDESKEVFVIADLSTVWLNLRINAQDIDEVKGGQPVKVKLVGQDNTAMTKISLLSPLIDERTRSLLARCSLDNGTGSLRPGSFVTASIVLGQSHVPLAIGVEAIQSVEGKTVIFVNKDKEKEGEFFPVPVVTGISDEKLVEIKSGLRTGDRVVVRNSFALKAELGKDSGGD